ncbi:Na+/H+-dicarboxylate symporter [Thermoflavifilum aggregans]|uniref:Na+/H+-dicarboxylate symporter n=2 Tax=Thermoflavifilum aggregans TaxID=454188 RepID=A0A2M9CRD0_9BACT|nr:Na+/H+-dicarboxylate symporter [Thermoflavifilum aggregans]
MGKNRLAFWILVALLAGACTGYVYREWYPDEASVKKFAHDISIVTEIFLRLIKMLIAPLVMSTLIVGVARVGDIRAVGRIGVKALVWFLAASFLSLCLGLLLVNIFQPGVHLHLPIPEKNAAESVATTTLDFRNFLTHVFPVSIGDAVTHNEILQIVVFSLFFGVAAAAMGEKAHPVVHFFEVVAGIMLKMTGYVIALAPIAVFTSLAATVAENGTDIIWVFGKLILEFYLGIGLLWILILLAGGWILKKKIFELIKAIAEPVMLAFSTASSEAAFPLLMERLQRIGCPDRIVSFVLPIGYSFNLDGSMMYMTFATMFIAQSYGIELDTGKQIIILLVLMVMSKGIAGVPRAALVVVAASLTMFHLPTEGVVLLLGIDQLFDMGRTATNVLGNAVATGVITRWEQGFAEVQPVLQEKISSVQMQESE